MTQEIKQSGWFLKHPLTDQRAIFSSTRASTSASSRVL
jgi:hypothetical protein